MEKLEAINIMLGAISQAPINTLVGNKSSRIIKAEAILETEINSIQLGGSFYNTEYNYPLRPNQDDEIILNNNILRVDIYDSYQYVQHGTKLYDKTNHTYKIPRQLTATVVTKLDFDYLPPVVQEVVVMNATNKYIVDVKQNKELYAYSQVKVAEAKARLMEAEIATGHYSMLNAYDDISRSV